MAKWFPPQISTAERTLIVLDDGVIVYDEDLQTLFIGDGVTAGGTDLTGPAGPTGPTGGGLVDVVDDTSPELGGTLAYNGFYVEYGVGTTIPSTSPLVMNTDGSYFLVSGTTGFASITVAANRFFTLEATGIFTITHGGAITVQGAANYTTAVGDKLLCQSTATNTVEIFSINRVDGTPVKTELANDSSPALAGPLVTTGFYSGSATGANLASASPLVMGIDGDNHTVTGVTGFSSITVAAHRAGVLTFEGALVITVGAGITLNNASGNYTTAAGDLFYWFSTAADTVVGFILKADGTSLVSAGGGSLSDLIGTDVASSSATLGISGFDSDTDLYLISWQDIKLSAGADLGFRVGDVGGIDSGSTDYLFHYSASTDVVGTYVGITTGGDNIIKLAKDVGTGTGQGAGGFLYLTRPGDGDMRPTFSGVGNGLTSGNVLQGGHIVGQRVAVIDLTQVQLVPTSGVFVSGRFSAWRVNHV